MSPQCPITIASCAPDYMNKTGPPRSTTRRLRELDVEIAEKDIVRLADAALGADYTAVRRIASSIARSLFEAGKLEAAQELRSLL
jgi:hypothetical protein